MAVFTPFLAHGIGPLLALAQVGQPHSGDGQRMVSQLAGHTIPGLARRFADSPHPLLMHQIFMEIAQ